MSKLQRPVCGVRYTFKQIMLELALCDSPTLFFKALTGREAIQLAHLTLDEMLVCDFANDSRKWVYHFTTNEWIPLFSLSDDKPGMLEESGVVTTERHYGEIVYVPAGTVFCSHPAAVA